MFFRGVKWSAKCYLSTFLGAPRSICYICWRPCLVTTIHAGKDPRYIPNKREKQAQKWENYKCVFCSYVYTQRRLAGLCVCSTSTSTYMYRYLPENHPRESSRHTFPKSRSSKWAKIDQASSMSRKMPRCRQMVAWGVVSCRISTTKGVHWCVQVAEGGHPERSKVCFCKVCFLAWYG